jgi:hypothetical protein
MSQVLVLNFEGIDGATEYLDEALGASPTTNDYCEIDTSWSKFGGSSLRMSSINSETATLAYKEILPENTGAFTIHAWVRTEASGYNMAGWLSLNRYTDGVFTGFVEIGARYDPDYLTRQIFAFDAQDHDEYISKLSDIEVVAGQEYHWAIVYDGQDVLFFIDGSLKETISLTNRPNPLAGMNGVWIRAYEEMWIDAVEVVHTAKWTSNFTPPTTAPVFVESGVPHGAILLTGYAPTHTLIEIPCGEITITGYYPEWVLPINAADITLVGYGPNFGPGPAEIPLAEIAMAGYAPSPVWVVPEALTASARTVYTLTITGAADGTTDIEIPMASFQARMRDGGPSYLACVVPNSTAYEPHLSARSNGDIEIRKGYEWPDGTRQLEVIARADFEHLYLDRGARADSMTVVGYRTEAAVSPKEWTVTGLSYYAMQADGKRRIRCEIDMFLRVGDTCVYGTGPSDSILVGAIQYQVRANPATAVMEVTEA